MFIDTAMNTALKVLKRLAFAACFFLSVQCFFAKSFFAQNLFAQSPLLPGQQERQSLSGGLIYQCFFDQQSDAEDRNGWPDYWTRKRGFENGIPFPDHLSIQITENANPFGNQVLQANMEGGAAAVFSPAIPVRAGMSYTLSAYVDIENLVFDEVSILANFYSNDSALPIRTLESNKIRGTSGWQQLKIGPIPAAFPNVQSVSIGLIVMPTQRQDYGGKVRFSNVEIRESPTVSLEMANENHLFFSTRELAVRCQFRGIDPALHSVLFILEDPFGRVIQQREFELMIGNSAASRFVEIPQDSQEVLHGTATWQNIPIRSYGFYRIRVAAPETYIHSLRLPADQTFDDPLTAIAPLSFVVMSPKTFFPGGEFGWNLDHWTHREIEESFPTLSQSGLSHLKLPLWLPPDATQEQHIMLRQLCSELSEQQVHLIGLLSPIPQPIRAALPPYSPVHAEAILKNDPRSWGDSMQATLQTLSLLVKDWQWTSDTDASLIDLFFDYDGSMSPAGRDRFAGFQKLFDQNQFGFGIGMTWNWNQDVPDASFPFPNCFFNFPVDDSITAEDAVLFMENRPAVPFRRGVSVSPLSAEDYSLETRLKNFVQSLVLLKASGVDLITLTIPRDEQRGVLRQNGTPSELYLPWRTTATLLSGSRLLGSMTLPNRSTNYCFDRGGGRCVMVVWNDWATPDMPIQESLYLGEGLEIIDMWEKHIIPEQMGNQQMIPVTPIPIFVTGLNIDIARFRLNMQTAVKSISSVPNRTHMIPFSYRNDSVFPASIKITPQSPSEGEWIIMPAWQSSNLESGDSASGEFQLTLTPLAHTGRMPFQYMVEHSGTHSPPFAVYDEMMIGNPDVFMEFTSHLNADGNMELVQIFVNNSNEIYTYDCQLTVPGRTPQKSRITRMGFGRQEYIYTIPRGQELFDTGTAEAMLRAFPVSDGRGRPLGEPMVYRIPLME